MARITVSYFRKVYNDFANDRITMSRMVELLNEKADEDESHFVCDRVNNYENNRCINCGAKDGHKCELKNNR